MKKNIDEKEEVLIQITLHLLCIVIYLSYKI